MTDGSLKLLTLIVHLLIVRLSSGTINSGLWIFRIGSVQHNNTIPSLQRDFAIFSSLSVDLCISPRNDETEGFGNSKLPKKAAIPKELMQAAKRMNFGLVESTFVLESMFSLRKSKSQKKSFQMVWSQGQNRFRVIGRKRFLVAHRSATCNCFFISSPTVRSSSRPVSIEGRHTSFTRIPTKDVRKIWRAIKMLEYFIVR
jgi:hypothetical protein